MASECNKINEKLRFVDRYLDGAYGTSSTALSVLYSPWIPNPLMGIQKIKPLGTDGLH
jgi:hypothetical protein